MLCYVMSCYVMFCYVMSCYVMFCYVLLYYVMSCRVMSCYLMSCHIMLRDINQTILYFTSDILIEITHYTLPSGVLPFYFSTDLFY